MSIETPSRRRLLRLVAAALISCSLPLSAQTAAWPERPVKLVVGYAPGGATDVLARLVAIKLGEQLGQTVIVENKSGANSNLGAELVARAPADGYTLFMFSIANTINASLYQHLSYDPLKDFEPVGLVAKVPNIMVVNAALPINSVADYIRFAKESKDGVTFASSGAGSSIHLSGEMFKMLSKANMLHIPYKGSAPAVNDLLGGQVQSMFDNAPSALPHVKSGRLRALAITSAARSPLLPDVPTIAESGFPGFDVQSWFGLVAPTGTPKPIVVRLNAELVKILAMDDVRQRLTDMGASRAPGTPADMGKFMASEVNRWREVVKASGAKAD